MENRVRFKMDEVLLFFSRVVSGSLDFSNPLPFLAA